MPNKLLTRPNELCLACDTKLVKQPNTLRRFYYCSENCRKSVQTGINPLGLSVNRAKRKTRNSKAGSELAMVWFVIRNLDEPLTGKQIMVRAKEIFNDNCKLNTENFHSLFPYFQEIEKIYDKVNKYYPLNKKLNFKQVLKPRYSDYLFGDNI